MSYYIDLSQISIDQYKEILRSANLLPSWMRLRDNIDTNLNALKRQGIHNLDELLEQLKSKTKIEALASASGLSVPYLNLLRRVVGGYRPKPNRIEDFRGIRDQTIEHLKASGIRNTRQLYPHIPTAEKRAELSTRLGIPLTEIIRLTRLTDLSRIKWVNHTFAYVLLEAGYDSAKKVANADYLELYETVKSLNERRKFYNAHIGANDMKRCIEAAKTLTSDIDYKG
ncbi:MAG: DUF4332 domain-containing protein [Roseivirga sp.]|nr:DUF4332 domain-containing protein [Roseivirga sp.]